MVQDFVHPQYGFSQLTCCVLERGNPANGLDSVGRKYIDLAYWLSRGGELRVFQIYHFSRSCPWVLATWLHRRNTGTHIYIYILYIYTRVIIQYTYIYIYIERERYNAQRLQIHC